ncbi:MAG: aldose 1-epimerase family protein [Clostridia bacterium]|nr:aldose 1-epimerase family protein [Clostridia bacterium]
MIYTLQNEHLTVKISDFGAELQSAVCRADGTEYLWQRDPKFWGDTAPWLFPICSRFFGGKYTLNGKTYEMGTHGFARKMTYTVTEATDTTLVMTISDTEETRKSYPFAFVFTIAYRLEGKTLRSTATMKNTGDVVMPATFGAHPGFNVPMGGAGKFEDYYLDFGEDASPDEIILTDDCFDSGRRMAYPLREGRYLDLKRELFAIDGHFFANVPEAITLASDKATHAVTIRYPGTRYFGFWTDSAADASFLCLEPWNGLPSFANGKTEDLSEKNDMFRLQPGKEKAFAVDIDFQ